MAKHDDFLPQILRGTRWEFATLTIARLNLVYRLLWLTNEGGALWPSYLYKYANGTWISRNSSWLLATFAYIAIVHGAMQVGLTTTYLGSNDAFHTASYMFAVFTLVGPVGIVTILFILYLALFWSNVILNSRRHFVMSGRREDQRSAKKKDTDPERLSKAIELQHIAQVPRSAAIQVPPPAVLKNRTAPAFLSSAQQ